MFLVGMWHYSPGTSWNFVIYSNLHAFAMLFNRWNTKRDRNRPWLQRTVIAATILAGFLAAMFALGRYALGLDEQQIQALLGLCAVGFLAATWLPPTGSVLNAAAHIVLVFHFTVLTRVFFRASSFPLAKATVGGLLGMETFALRPGLLSSWLWAALLVGTAYHFTPKRWVDDFAYRVFRRLPGFVLGLLFSGLALGLMKLMAGAPRAFIYFQF
jgi:D-alanyl-lipoteichoic acid acyltransferase DltB (MBOAT superfamily)